MNSVCLKDVKYPVKIEHFQKCCRRSEEEKVKAVFLSFGFRLRQGYGGQVVLARSQGYSNLLLRRSSKILAPNWRQHFFKRSGGTFAS
jgi:hypothetical protein